MRSPMRQTTSTITERGPGPALLVFFVLALPGAACAADAAAVRVAAIERVGDPHAGQPRVEGARCELRRQRWVCARYTGSRLLLPTPPQLAADAWANLPPAAAHDLVAALRAQDAIHLGDTAPEGTHAVTTSVYVESAEASRRFRVTVVLGAPLPDRPQDRAAAAIWNAVAASGARSQVID
jgi:hypothetical protein